MFMLKNVVQNKFIIWRLFRHHCQLELKNVKNSKLVRHTLKSRILYVPTYFFKKYENFVQNSKRHKINVSSQFLCFFFRFLKVKFLGIVGMRLYRQFQEDENCLRLRKNHVFYFGVLFTGTKLLIYISSLIVKLTSFARSENTMEGPPLMRLRNHFILHEFFF